MSLRWPKEWIGSPTRVFLIGVGVVVAVMGWTSLSDGLPQRPSVLPLLSPVIIAVCALAFLMHPRLNDRAMAVIAVCFLAALADPVLYEPFISAPAVVYAAFLAAAYSKRTFMPVWLGLLLAGVMVGIGRMLYNAQAQFEDREMGTSFVLGWLAMSVVAWIVVGFLWRLGLDTRSRRQAMATLEQRAELVAITERNRIAREMHDIVPHSLSGIMALADGARFAAATNPDIATETLGKISDESRQALTHMRGRIRDMAAEGRAVLVSSHLMAEMQVTADRLVVIRSGELIGEGDLNEFLGESPVEVVCDQPDVLARALDGRVEGDRVVVDKHTPADVGAHARDLGVAIYGLTEHRASLEDAFLTATAQEK